MAQHLNSRPRQTPRFIIRPFRRRDVGPMHDAVQASLPELEEWLPWAVGYDRSVAHRFIRDSASAWNDARAYDFAIRLHEEPDFHVGNISVWPTSPANRVGEIGYWIRSDLTGEGIGTEVTARTIQVGFEELNYHKIVLRIAAGNERSDRSRRTANSRQQTARSLAVGCQLSSVCQTEWGGPKAAPFSVLAVSCWLSAVVCLLEPHAAHAAVVMAAGRHRRKVFLLLSDEHLGRDKESRYGSSVLQCRPGHLGRIDDAVLDEVGSDGAELRAHA